MRLQKYMALCGVDSRRKCEELIASGVVEVNGATVCEPGTQVDEVRDRVKVRGMEIRPPERKRTLLFYKPSHCVTTLSDPQGRQTVMDYLRGVPERVYPVGRLDYATEGLLLLTNDGELANMLTHPSHEVEKTYRADVAGEVSEDMLRRLREGVMLSDGMTAPARAWIRGGKHGNTTIVLTIREGRNRQVRRMLEAVGKEVLYLCREEVAGLTLTGLSPGKYRDITDEELRKIREFARKTSVLVGEP